MMLCVSFEISWLCGRIVVGVVIFCAPFFGSCCIVTRSFTTHFTTTGMGNGWIVVCVFMVGMGRRVWAFFWLYYTAVAVDDIYTHSCIEIDEIVWDVVLCLVHYHVYQIQSAFPSWWSHFFNFLSSFISWGGGATRKLLQLGTDFGKVLT